MSCSLRRNAVAKLLSVLLGVAGMVSAHDAASIEWLPIWQPLSYPDGIISVDDEGLVFEVGYHREIYRWSPATGAELIVSLDAGTATAGGLVFDVSAHGQSIDGNAWITATRMVSLAICPDFEPYQMGSFLIDDGGEALLVAAPGLSVPERPDWTLVTGGECCNGISAPRVGDQGDVAYFARVQQRSVCDSDEEAPLADALFASNAAGETVVIAFPGDPVPGDASGSTLSPLRPVEMNASGEVAFRADITDGSTGESQAALFRWTRAAGLRVIASGSDVESPYLGWTFRIGAGGHVAYLLDGALLVGDVSGATTTAMAPFDATPGLPGYVFGAVETPPYSSYQSDFAVNGVGDVAFAASVTPPGFTGPSRWSLWSPDASGAMVLRLIEGQAAPFVEGRTIVYQYLPSVLALNDAGEVLVQVELGPSASQGELFAYYLIDAAGNVQLLLRSNQSFEFAPGDSRPGRMYGPHFDVSLRHLAFEAFSLQGPPTNDIFRGVLPETSLLGSSIVALASLAAVRARRRR